MIRSTFANGVRKKRSTVALNNVGSSKDTMRVAFGKMVNWLLGDVVVDRHRMLIANEVVIGRHHQGGRGDGFECLQLDVGLVVATAVRPRIVRQNVRAPKVRHRLRLQRN